MNTVSSCNKKKSNSQTKCKDKHDSSHDPSEVNNPEDKAQTKTKQKKRAKKAQSKEQGRKISEKKKFSEISRESLDEIYESTVAKVNMCLQSEKENKTRRKRNTQNDSENFNTQNIPHQISLSEANDQNGNISAIKSNGNYNPSKACNGLNLAQESQPNQEDVSDRQKKALATHKRRKFEEEKENPDKAVLTSWPLRSGELVCEEELSIDEGNSHNHHGNDAYVTKSVRGEPSKRIPITSRRVIDHDLIRYCMQKEGIYAASPEILEDNQQPMINWKMRALLLDWMIEVSSEFNLQRETMYLAVNYLDRYIGGVLNIQRTDFQLVGTTALYLACKMEELHVPKINFFILATDNGYTKSQILNMERKMARELNWNLTPCSLESWLNIICTKWDKFIEYQDNSEEIQEINNNPRNQGNSFKFLEILECMKNYRSPTSEKLCGSTEDLYKLMRDPSFKRYKEITQILDTIILDVDSLQYSPQAISLCIIYCVLLLDLNIFTTRELINYEFQDSNLLFALTRGLTEASVIQSDLSQEEINQRIEVVKQKIVRMDKFVQLFSDFLQYEFKIQFDELIPTRDFIYPYAGGVLMKLEQSRRYSPGEFNPLPLFVTNERSMIHCVEETWGNFQAQCSFISSRVNLRNEQERRQRAGIKQRCFRRDTF
ncbi:unnamed protein product [Moneuplotes crassus]|uniref:Cyclin-like domain-containing protein n=1 Tax=Euplotes crassus TaxID=5936 RepID=A0AAD1XFV0_EUPCR|nr:unnamed protein product [Moneuplotes crassus]